MDILDSLTTETSSQPIYDSKWSELQTAIFDQVQDPSQNLLISAGAGCGKTTTILQAMRYAPGTSLFMAFNKSIANELKEKVGGAGEVKTLNALGHGLFWRNARSAQLNANKSRELLKRLMGEGSQDYRDFAYVLTRAIGLMKNCAFGLDGVPVEQSDVAELMDSYQLDIPFDKLPQLSAIALKAFRLSNQDLATFDFDDQLYLPLLHRWSFPHWDNVFVDECQDLSPIQHLMLNELQKSGARITAVGDRFQAIYGFRGALTDSMDQLKKRFAMRELPLSLSYRCAKLIVATAGDYCDNTLRALESAPEGTILTAEEEPSLFPPEAMVLCRNNGPLFRSILRHVRARSPCRVMTNFTETFPAFVRSFKVQNTTALIQKLTEWFEKEKTAAEKKGFRGKIAMLKDKYETTLLLAKEFTWVDDMLDMVAKLSISQSGPVFATVHKAKGLENQSVFILRPDLMPSPFAQGEDALRQERNIIYVAVTRAKLQLTWGPEGF